MDLMIAFTCIVIVFLEFLKSFDAKSVQPQLIKNEATFLWRPSDGRTRDEWFRCRGLPCNDWRRTSTVVALLEKEVDTGTTESSETFSHGEDNELAEQTDGSDLLLLPSQAEELLIEQVASKGRTKRAVTKNEDQRWSLPIFYKFDGDHSSVEQKIIRKAIKQWEDHTCVRFFEVNKGAVIARNHLIFTKQLRACASFVGKIQLEQGNPQMINLGEHCFNKPGIAVHEIGHALGLWHRHQAPTRDDSITVHTNQISTWAQVNFVKVPVNRVADYSLPYDYNSVMHYSGMVGSKYGDRTITTNDIRFQRNIGQRIELSFLDAKAINLAYCQAECKSTQLKQPCLRGGYQNPNDCTSCICPDGLSGKYCHLPKDNPGCGGDYIVSEGDAVQILSPSYGSKYRDFIECNWLFHGDNNQKLRLEFLETFGIYETDKDLCPHWIEIRTGKDFSEPGPRLCGYELPDEVFDSETSEMLVTFRAPVESTKATSGFKFRVTSAAQPQHEPPPGTITVSWSEWSECSKQCQCGGCATRSRHTMCNGKRCEGLLKGKETESCSRACHSGDKELWFSGRFRLRECPECCQGYRRLGDECVAD